MLRKVTSQRVGGAEVSTSTRRASLRKNQENGCLATQPCGEVSAMLSKEQALVQFAAAELEPT